MVLAHCKKWAKKHIVLSWFQIFNNSVHLKLDDSLVQSAVDDKSLLAHWYNAKMLDFYKSEHMQGSLLQSLMRNNIAYEVISSFYSLPLSTNTAK